MSVDKLFGCDPHDFQTFDWDGLGIDSGSAWLYWSEISAPPPWGNPPDCLTPIVSDLVAKPLFSQPATWEDWGITPGQDVTTFQVVSIDCNGEPAWEPFASYEAFLFVGGPLIGPLWHIDAITDTDLNHGGHLPGGPWITKNGFAPVSIPVGAQPSSSPVQLVIAYTGGQPGIVLDNILIRLNPTTGPALRNPWTLQEHEGRLHNTGVDAGGIVYFRSNYAVPKPSWAVSGARVTKQNTDTDPRMIRDLRGRLRLTFGRSGAGMETVSDDDGETWSDPSVSIPSITHPTIATATDGAIVRAGYRGGNLVGTYQAPGDVAESDVFTFVDEHDVPIEVEDDTFHLMQAWEGAGRWVLHVILLGDGSSSTWASADECRTWQRAD